MDPLVQGGPPVVKRLARTKGVADGELRGRRWLREDWSLELRWLPTGAEGWGGSARSRGRGWEHWMDGGGPACDELNRSMVAAELAGDEEDGLPPSMAGYGGASEMA